MIANRDNEIRTFRPEPFWDLLTQYRDVTFRYARDRFATEPDAQAVLDQVVDQPFAITKVDKKPERERPPLLHDLTDLQREMNRRYGMSADATLKAAQSLYESKLISYPRTDSRHLSRDLKPKMPGILSDLRKQWPTEVGRLDLARLTADARIYDDAKVADHHAIIPTGKAPGALGPALKKVYDAIVLRLIAAFYPACVREVTTVLGESARRPVPGQRGPRRRSRLDRARPAQTLRPVRGNPGPPRVRRRRDRPPRPLDPPGGNLAPQAVHRGDLARRDGNGGQAGRRRGPPRGPQGARPRARRRPAPRSSRPCSAATTSSATGRTWPRPTSAAT